MDEIRWGDVLLIAVVAIVYIVVIVQIVRINMEMNKSKKRDLPKIPTFDEAISQPKNIVVTTSATRPTGTELCEGLMVYETDTKRFYVVERSRWKEKR